MTDPAQREQIVRTLADLGFDLQRHSKSVGYMVVDRRAELGLPGSLQPIVGSLEGIVMLLNLRPTETHGEISSGGDSAAKDVHWTDRNKTRE